MTHAKTAKYKTPLLEIGLFRITLGVYLLYYNLLLLPHVSLYFGLEGMLPKYFLPKFLMVAPDFFPWPEYWFIVLFYSMMILLICFILGWLNKLTLIPLFLLQLYFYHANPLIIHEPQPLANLFLFLFFFLPPNSPPLLLNKNSFEFTEDNIKELKSLLRIIIFFFGVYYLFVGLKKLPDPLWRQGLAIKHILLWPGIARQNFITAFITQTPGVSQVISYGTLLFEIGFIFLVFTPLRFLLIVGGILLHGGIFCTMEVGTLSQVLLVWYALLLDEPTRAKFRWRN
ncbi:MAG: hypothetical protein AB7S78_09580 [Candidatus Omnitrophota bacterium]